MSNMVTRCPKCATSFRITSAQLQSAKGAVRCGSCLHIFKAQDHLISSEAPTAKAAASTTKAPTSTTTATTPKSTNTIASATTPTTRTASPAKPAASVTSNAPQQAPAPASTKKMAENTVKAAASQPVAPKPVAAKTNSATNKPAARPAQAALSSQAVSSTKVAAANVAKPAALKPGGTDSKPASSPVNQPTISPAQPATTGSAGEQKLAFDQDAINRELALSGDDDFLISDDMDDAPSKKEEGYDFDGFLDIDGLPKQHISLFERDPIKEKPKDENDEDESDADEAWAMELLDDADDDLKYSSLKHEIEQKEQQEDTHHDSFQQPSISDSAEEEYQQAQKLRSPGQMFSLIGEKSDPQDDITEEIHAQPYNDNALYHQALNDVKDDSRMRAFDTSRAALLMNIMPEPLEMTTRRKPGWYKKRLWFGLSLLMVVVLALQVAWLQFNRLSRIEPYRTAYKYICPIFDCTLPTLVDRSKIRAYNLVVRNHPQTPNALMVDAIILNNALFDQPFPDLVLAFSTMNDIPVAARRFKPSEYLGGELAGQHLMPQNQPVHLTLELVDPGPEAVNYRAYIPE